MSGLVGRILGIPKAPKLAGFQVQTSVYGRPIPIVYGTTRVAGNLLQMPTQPVLENSHQSKASRATKGSASGETYIAPILIALCEGPIAGLGSVWRDKDAKVDFTAKYAADWHLSVGDAAPSAWLVPAANQRLGYQFTAWVANQAVELPSGSLSQYSWEIQGFLRFNAGGGIIDASPADIAPDFLTNAQYGVGFASTIILTPTNWQDYCAAAGLFCSPAMDTQRPAAEWLNDLCEIGNAALVWSDGNLKFIPFGDTALSGNGHTYTPNTTPLYDLTDSHFLAAEGEDPIKVTRTDPATAVNQVTVEYLDRAHDYNVATYTAQDQLAIEQYGVIPLTLTLHEICDAQVAQQVAQMRLQREQNVRNTYAFSLGWKFSLLEPMDLVTLTDPGLGLNRTTVRITSIVEKEGEAGFDVVAEEWPFGTASATRYATPSMTGSLPNANVDPGNTTTPIIFEGPTPLQSSPLEVWVGASGGANWGGCDVYVSVDNVNFQKVGRIIGKATFGVTTAALASAAAYPAIDTTNTLAVDLTASGGALVTQSQANFDNLIPLCYLGGREFVAFRDAALASALHYNLTHLYRGLYSSTIPTSHASASDFVFCDDAILRIPWPLGYIGQILYFKFPAFNTYGAALQDVSTVSSVSHTVGQDPVIPGAGSGTALANGTVTVAADGSWTATIDLPSSALSCRYIAQTTGFASESTVASSGTISNANPTTFSGTLAAGQTIYITVVPFSGASATGTQLKGSHITTIQYAQSTPQGTVSIDANGAWSFSVDGPPNAQSFRYEASPGGSITGYPTDASTASVGTIVTGGRSMSVNNGGTLSFGQTIWITVIPYTGASATGTQLPSIHIRGSYLTYSATKSVSYHRSGWHDMSLMGYGTTVDNGITNPALASTVIRDRFCMDVIVPVGVNLITADFTVSWNTATNPLGNFALNVKANNTSINFGTATYGAGWQTVSVSLGSTLTTSNAISFENTWNPTFGGNSDAGQAELNDVVLTYSAPTPDKTV